MKYNPEKHHRRSLRLKGYDYSSPGAYFITICTYQRECLLGEIVQGEMQLNAIGQLVQAFWQRLPLHFAIELDEFVVMPNHVHGILWLGVDNGRGEAFGKKFMAPTKNCWSNASPLQICGTTSGSLGAIVQNFKSISTQKVNRIFRREEQRLWQRNYYEHIIRDAVALQRIQEYIQTNPLSWHLDQLHPQNFPE